MRWRIAACVCAALHGICASAASTVRESDATGGADSLVVVTWNIAWFGHPAYPPENDALQIINAASVIEKLQAHVYALQEIASVSAFQQLLTLLGPKYAGSLSDPQGLQRLAFIYDKDVLRVEWLSDRDLASHAHAFGGRPPLIMRGRPLFQSTDNAWTFITIHMKAFFDSESRARRAAAASALKEYADPVATRFRLVLLGDFNDDVDESLGGGASPYVAIRLDTSRYFIPTLELSRSAAYTYCSNPDCTSGSVIDHVVASRNLAPFVHNVRRADEVLTDVGSFVATTSDHLPVRVAFYFARSEGAESEGKRTVAKIHMLPPFPNPASATLTIPIELSSAGRVTIHATDVLGRRRTIQPATAMDEGLHHLAVNATGLAVGAWIICATVAHNQSCQLVAKLR